MINEEKCLDLLKFLKLELDQLEITVLVEYISQRQKFCIESMKLLVDKVVKSVSKIDDEIMIYYWTEIKLLEGKNNDRSNPLRKSKQK